MGALLDRHAPRLRAIAGALLPHAHEQAHREDAVQEAFLRAFRELRTLRDDTRFGPWLCGIARRVCIDVVRGRIRRAPSVPLDAAGDPPAAAAGPHLELVADEQTRAVKQAIASLPVKLREVVWLFYYSGESHESIAAFTGVRLPTVNARLRKARELLRHRLRELAPEGGSNQ